MVRDKGFHALSDPVMQSPNCNPIEHLWLILKKQIRARHPSNIHLLKVRLSVTTGSSISLLI